MRTHIYDVFSAATPTNRELRFYSSGATHTKRELRFFPFSTGRPLFAILAMLGAAIGITILLFQGEPADYEPYRGQSVQVTGTVCSLEPRRQEDTIVWRMVLSNVGIESPAAAPDSDDTAFQLNRGERVLCILDYEPGVDMSARVRVRGKLYPFRSAMNEGEFDLHQYYYILRIAFSLRDVKLLAASGPTDRLAASLFHFKSYLSSIIDRLFSEENSPVLKAMLLGEKGLLEEETRELYQGAGIVHILSISGLHLSLLGMGFFSLTGKCRWIPMPVRAAVSIIAVFLYGKMIGMGTSVFRALIMLTLYILAKVIGRTYDILTAASIAAFLLLLDQPLYLLHTGFQFSFCAVLAIGILLPALPGRILKALAIPLATLPVYLWAYGTFPPISLLLNLIVIPLMTVVMISAGGAVLAEAILGRLLGLSPQGVPSVMPAPATANLSVSRHTGVNSAAEALSASEGIPRLLGLPAELILDFYRFLAESSRKVPGHEIVLGRPSPIRILLFYGMLLFLAAVSVRLQMPHMRRRIEAAAVSAGVAEVLMKDKVIPTKAVTVSSGGAAVSTKMAAGRSRSRQQNESREDCLLRRAAEKVCRIFHLKDNGSRKNFACLLICSWMAAAVLVLTACRRVPAFEMDLLYVGQGDGVFITSHGRNFLIDGGSSTKEDLAKYTLIPFLHSKGRCRLDGIILTHDDGDHCSGILELLEAAAEGDPQIAVSVIYMPDIAEEAKGEHYRRIEELSAQVGIPVQYICRGMRIRSGNLTLDCLHPAMGASYEDANEYSTTLLLRYGKPQLSVGDFSSARNYVSAGNTALEQGHSAQGLSGSPNSISALLTGDLEGQGEADLLQYLSESSLMNGRELQLKIDVLKVAHHGSKNATSEEFLQVVHPDMAMISAGINNMYKHPSEELLNRLAVTIPLSSVYRTDQQGEISILYNKKGGHYQVKTFLGDRAEALNH